MSQPRTVGGIEQLPIYVVATEAEAWTVSEDQYIDSVPLAELMERRRPDEHIYLVHLEYRATHGRLKLTDLTPTRLAGR